MMDVIIIGGGVIGALTARELSRYQLSVTVTEAEKDVCCGTSKANSAIIHGGFDAPHGSNKARLNVIGNRMMDRVAKELSVPFHRNGSLVAAFSDEEVTGLKKLFENGILNGVPGLKLISGHEARLLEPSLSKEVVMALEAPSGGIICPYELTINAMGNGMNNGVELVRGFRVREITPLEKGYRITAEDGRQLDSKFIINTAGLFSDSIAHMTGDMEISIKPRKGEYLLLDKSAGKTVKRTIFQTPTAKGKGVLVTPTVDGNLLLGPTAEEVLDKNDTLTSGQGLKRVMEMAGKSIPALKSMGGGVITSFAGLRAGESGHDFIIRQSKKCPGAIHIAGIESPGLSAAPAIAVEAAELLNELGCTLTPKADFDPTIKPFPKFREMSYEERAELIRSNPSFGRIVCRCESVTEGEILEALRRNPKAVDLDGVKRRTRAGMGRCGGGFCSTETLRLIAEEMGVKWEQVTKFGGNSYLLTGITKGGADHE